VEVRITYDRSVDAAYIYLVPIEAASRWWRPREVVEQAERTG
jgi:hypothetical protein